MKIVLPDIKTLTNGDLDLSVLEQYGEVITYNDIAKELAKQKGLKKMSYYAIKRR